MKIAQRYRHDGEFSVVAAALDGLIGAVLLFLLLSYWPFRMVPTGSRDVITQFGAIKGVQNEGLVILAPWERLALLSVPSRNGHHRARRWQHYRHLAGGWSA